MCLPFYCNMGLDVSQARDGWMGQMGQMGWDGILGHSSTLTNLTMNSLYRGYRGVLYLALPGSTWLYSTAHRVSA